VYAVAALIDAGFLYAMLNRRDPHHGEVLQVAQTLLSPVYLPIPMVTEVAYLLQKYVGTQAMADFVAGLASTQMRLVTPEPDDYRRAAEITRQYEDAPLDFVDTLIVAVAERLEVTTILALDQRHFRLVRPRHCAAFEIRPSQANRGFIQQAACRCAFLSYFAPNTQLEALWAFQSTSMSQATFRFYGDLNYFLASEQQNGPVVYSFDQDDVARSASVLATSMRADYARCLLLPLLTTL
jgi:uncharacterized protein